MKLPSWNHISVFSIIAAFFPSETIEGTNERHLLHHLFEENHYNPLERPVENESSPVVVNFGLVLQQIIDVDEKNQIIYTNIWLQMTWTDANLVWDPREFGGVMSIRVPAKKIWRPDVLLYNSADDGFDGTFYTNVIIYYNGTCLWIPPGMFKSTCSIDISKFPFDDQKCMLKFGSWTHNGWLVDLRLSSDAGDTSSFIRSGEWELIGVPAVRNVKKYECCYEDYIDITFTIHIRRRILYYGFNIIIPCVLISSMSLLLFVLPPDSGEKISLGVTIMLSLMVFLLLVAETMPPTSDAVPLIGIYFCCIMVMCSMSLMCTVIVLNFHYREPETHTLPNWVKTVINRWLAWILRMKRPGHRMSRSKIIQRPRFRDIRIQERSSNSLLANVLELDDDTSLRLENGSSGISIKIDECNKSVSFRTELLAILKELRWITRKYKKDEDATNIRSDWKFAAMVIDRLCFWLCLTFTGVSTVAIVISAPHVLA